MANRKRPWTGGDSKPRAVPQAAGAAYAAQVRADAERGWAEALEGLVLAAHAQDRDLQLAGLGVAAGAMAALLAAASVPCPGCGEQVHEETWDDEDCEGRAVALCRCGMVRFDGHWYARLPEAES